MQLNHCVCSSITGTMQLSNRVPQKATHTHTHTLYPLIVFEVNPLFSPCEPPSLPPPQLPLDSVASFPADLTSMWPPPCQPAARPLLSSRVPAARLYPVNLQPRNLAPLCLPAPNAAGRVSSRANGLSVIRIVSDTKFACEVFLCDGRLDEASERRSLVVFRGLV